MITSNSANICDQPLEKKGVKEVNAIYESKPEWRSKFEHALYRHFHEDITSAKQVFCRYCAIIGTEGTTFEEQLFYASSICKLKFPSLYLT